MNTVAFDLLNEWNTGFTAGLSVTNTGTRPLTNWTLEFTAPFQITNIWNAEIVSRQGDRYVIRNTSWNSSIPPNGTASFGFNGNKSSNIKPAISNIVFNGAPVGVPGALPSLNVDDISLTEGNSGSKTATFTLNLSAASRQAVKISYVTENGTAIAGSDFTAATGRVTFAPGETRKTVTVNVRGDTAVEANETFGLKLLNPENVTLRKAQGTATITNDDGAIAPPPLAPRPAPTAPKPPAPAPALPQLTINDVTVVEGNSGTTQANFTVRLSSASTQAVQVNYATANDTTSPGSDYAPASGTLIFEPGQTSKTITVNVIGDTIVESTERFTVNLSNPVNAAIADRQGIGTITNDDVAPPLPPQPGPVNPPLPSQSGGFNYGEALQKAILFYEAQRSGKLPADNRVPWRKDSALKDGADVGRDLTGGYYDAGDHVKFGFPMAASMTMLSWGADQYKQAYQKSGQLPYILDAIKWGTDYILKAHVTDANGTKEFWGQVGAGGPDHSYWGSAETMTMARPSFKIDRQRPGSDLAGEAAAALASASIVFRDVDPAYSDRLLKNAAQLFDFADKFRGKYSDSIRDAGSYYNSFNGFNDELVWSAVWLHKAMKAAGTPNATYLTKAESMYQGVARGWTQSWDEKSHGAAILLAQETGKSRYRSDVETWLNHWTDKSGAGIKYTSGGLAWLDQWGSLRYSANTSFLAGIYADTINDPNNRYSNFAEDQIEYMLGDNPNRRSYMVGFGNNSPKNPHHRNAHGSTTNNITSPTNNRHILYGALVGGPSAPNDNAYSDDRTNFITNEVALDYNAGFTGALARMYDQFGGTPLPNDFALTTNSLSAGFSGALQR